MTTKLEHYKDTKWWQISSDDHSGNEDDSLADTPAFALWKEGSKIYSYVRSMRNYDVVPAHASRSKGDYRIK